MGYALFAQRKLVLDMQLNTAQLMQTQRANEQFALATESASLQQQLSSNQVAQSGELAELYGRLAETDGSTARDQINDQIKQRELEFEKELQGINNQIYEVGIKENAIEMEVKRLDTVVTTLEKQLEAVEQAEGKAIDRATPHFGGLQG